MPDNKARGPEPRQCPRTLCSFKRGEPLDGFYCAYTFTGRIPNTGPRVCLTCGQPEPSPAEPVTDR